jgi:hydroxyacylglutathione hydrolase
MVHIKQFEFSPFQENTYLLYTDDKSCWIIDPGCYFPEEKQELKTFIASNELKVERLLLTHCHLDHVFGNAFIHQEYDVSPEYHKLDEPTMKMAPISASMYNIPGFETSPAPKSYLKEGDALKLGNEDFEIRFCPGHAPGHVVFIHHDQKIIIGGDVIFKESIGRTDLPGGNHATLIQSIEEQIFTLPDDYTIYSGHGDTTIVGHEKKHNPFLS